MNTPAQVALNATCPKCNRVYAIPVDFMACCRCYANHRIQMLAAECVRLNKQLRDARQ